MCLYLVPRKVPETQLQNIVENEDESIIIRFGSERSIKIDPLEGSRKSTSHISQRIYRRDI